MDQEVIQPKGNMRNNRVAATASFGNEFEANRIAMDFSERKRQEDHTNQKLQAVDDSTFGLSGNSALIEGTSLA